MTVLEDLQQLERRIIKRAGELRDAVEEFDQLRAAAARLGIDLDKVDDTAGGRRATQRRNGSSRRKRVTAGGDASPALADVKATAKTRQKRTTAKPTKQAAGTSRHGGSRRETVMRLVEQRPGITVAEIGQELKVNPTGLYRVVRDLEGAGKLKKEGKALAPVGR